MSIGSRYASLKPTICIICKKQAGVAYSPYPDRLKTWLWGCGATECSGLLRKVYRMAEHTYNAYEVKARSEASDAAGQYLDSIGETDLAKLPPEHWFVLWETFMNAYQRSMVRMLTEHEAPF